MKKKWKIILGLVILLLLIPIPSGVYEDGGTRAYTALTYKIVDWHHLYGDGTYDKVKVYPFPMNFLSMDSLLAKEEKNFPMNQDSEDTDRNLNVFKAEVIEMTETTIIVEPVIGEAERKSSDRISVSKKDLDCIEDVIEGDVIEITYEGGIAETYPASIHALDWKYVSNSKQDDDRIVFEKPVIYLYPEVETQVSVRVQLEGRLSCVYPSYENGWEVTALPDGTLRDKNGQIYNYLYWEGLGNTKYDMSKGFCVKGEDTAAFLEKALEELGLNRKEANEFIIYWLPQMEQNLYNLISFQGEDYTNAARLEVNPAPDTMIRVFMTWQKSDTYVEMEEQELSAPKREGFTLVEWGGAEMIP